MLTSKAHRVILTLMTSFLLISVYSTDLMTRWWRMRSLMDWASPFWWCLCFGYSSVCPFVFVRLKALQNFFCLLEVQFQLQISPHNDDTKDKTQDSYLNQHFCLFFTCRLWLTIHISDLLLLVSEGGVCDTGGALPWHHLCSSGTPRLSSHDTHQYSACRNAYIYSTFTEVHRCPHPNNLSEWFNTKWTQ